MMVHVDMIAHLGLIKHVIVKPDKERRWCYDRTET